MSAPEKLIIFWHLLFVLRNVFIQTFSLDCSKLVCVCPAISDSCEASLSGLLGRFSLKVLNSFSVGNCSVS